MGKARKNQSTYINLYELDPQGLNIKQFVRNEEWVRYIYDNRNGKQDLLSNYDVVIGPIANDTIYDVMGITTSGYLSIEEALQLLQVGPAYTQVAIKTLKAKSQLKWLGKEEIQEEDLLGYKFIVEAEEKEFQAKFAEKLVEIVGD